MVNYTKAAQCAVLCQEVYQQFSPQLRFTPFPNTAPILVTGDSTDTQCAIVTDRSTSEALITFRGSEKKVADWETNFDLQQNRVEFQETVIQDSIVGERDQVYPYGDKDKTDVRMHEGFATAYLSVRNQIHTHIRDNAITHAVVTGHSLGGALATVCAVDLQYNFSPGVTIAIYTFGSPRVGNNDFRESFNRRVPNCCRFVNGMDIVPALPRPWQGYNHVDTEYRLGNRLSWRFFSQRFRDHDIRAYIDALKTLASS